MWEVFWWRSTLRAIGVPEMMGNLSLCLVNNGSENIGGDSDVENEQDRDSDEADIHQHPNNYSASVEELCTGVMSMRGSRCHDHLQNSLRKELLLQNNESDVRFSFELSNKRDINAILLQSKLNGKWCFIGYVPDPKVPKVRRALKNGELKMATLKNVFFKISIYLCVKWLSLFS